MSTNYVILANRTSGGTYTVVGTDREASSAEQAVREWVIETTGPDGIYVAVPERSWKPVEITSTTRRQITIVDPDAPVAVGQESKEE